MKTLRQYGAPCHVCNGTGIFESVLGNHECSICNGTGVTIIVCESDPILIEIFQIPEHIDEKGKRKTLFDLIDINPKAYDDLYQ